MYDRDVKDHRIVDEPLEVTTVCGRIVEGEILRLSHAQIPSFLGLQASALSDVIAASRHVGGH